MYYTAFVLTRIIVRYTITFKRGRLSTDTEDTEVVWSKSGVEALDAYR